jgi:hypothetical protein
VRRYLSVCAILDTLQSVPRGGGGVSEPGAFWTSQRVFFQIARGCPVIPLRAASRAVDRVDFFADSEGGADGSCGFFFANALARIAWRAPPRTKRTPQTQTGGARLHGPPCVPPATPASQRNAGLGTTLVTTATMGVLFAGGTGPAVRCRTAHSGVSPTVIPIFCSFGLIAAKASRKRSDGNVSSIAT